MTKGLAQESGTCHHGYMDTIIMSGNGPTLRLKMGSDLGKRDSDDESAQVAILSDKIVNNVDIHDPFKLKFSA